MRLRPYKSCDAEKVGFVDKEIVPHERDNIVEMAITKEEFG